MYKELGTSSRSLHMACACVRACWCVWGLSPSLPRSHAHTSTRDDFGKGFARKYLGMPAVAHAGKLVRRRAASSAREGEHKPFPGNGRQAAELFVDATQVVLQLLASGQQLQRTPILLHLAPLRRTSQPPPPLLSGQDAFECIAHAACASGKRTVTDAMHTKAAAACRRAARANRIKRLPIFC